MSSTEQLLTELKTDMKYVRTDVTDIKEALGKQNGSIKMLNEWKVGHEQYFKIWSRIITLFGVPIALFAVYKAINFVV